MSIRMNAPLVGRLCLMSALALSVSACALLPHRARWATITPVGPA
jgi:hypothetical protein